jgi:nitrogen fixation NifU-like protein
LTICTRRRYSTTASIRGIVTNGGANHHAEGYNPLCGDKLKLYLKLKDDIVEGRQLRGQRVRHFHRVGIVDDREPEGLKRGGSPQVAGKFHDLLTTDSPVTQDLGKLVVFCGVRDYPARVKCATLAWHTLKSALENKEDPVTTE